MTPTEFLAQPIARRLAAAALACGAALASAATPPDARATPAPTQPAARSGDYEVLEIGEVLIHAKCVDGGWVYVTKPAEHGASAPQGRSRVKGIPDERDAAIRAACLAVDYTR